MFNDTNTPPHKQQTKNSLLVLVSHHRVTTHVQTIEMFIHQVSRTLSTPSTCTKMLACLAFEFRMKFFNNTMC